MSVFIQNLMKSPLILNHPVTSSAIASGINGQYTLIAPGATEELDNDLWAKISAGDLALESHIDRGRIAVRETALPVVPGGALSDQNTDVVSADPDPANSQIPADRKDKVQHEAKVEGVTELQQSVKPGTPVSAPPKKGRPPKQAKAG